MLFESYPNGDLYLTATINSTTLQETLVVSQETLVVSLRKV